MNEQENGWVRTGKAAALLGYSTGHFRAKFYEIFLAKKDVLRLPGGHCRWRLKAVMQLEVFGQHMKNAG